MMVVAGDSNTEGHFIAIGLNANCLEKMMEGGCIRVKVTPQHITDGKLDNIFIYAKPTDQELYDEMKHKVDQDTPVYVDDGVDVNLERQVSE